MMMMINILPLPVQSLFNKIRTLFSKDSLSPLCSMSPL